MQAFGNSSVDKTQVLRDWVDKATSQKTQQSVYRPKYTLVQDLQIIIHLHDNMYNYKGYREYEMMLKTLEDLVVTGKTNRTVSALYRRYQHRLWQIDEDGIDIIVAFIEEDGSYDAYLNFQYENIIVLVERKTHHREIQALKQLEKYEQKRLKKKQEDEGHKNYLRDDKPEPNYKLYSITPQELKASEYRQWKSEFQLKKQRDILLLNKEIEVKKEKKYEQLYLRHLQYEKSLENNWREHHAKELQAQSKECDQEQEVCRQRIIKIWEDKQNEKIQGIMRDYNDSVERQRKKQQAIWRASWQQQEKFRRQKIRQKWAERKAQLRILGAAENSQMTIQQKMFFLSQLDEIQEYFLTIIQVKERMMEIQQDMFRD